MEKMDLTQYDIKPEAMVNYLWATLQQGVVRMGLQQDVEEGRERQGVEA